MFGFGENICLFNGIMRLICSVGSTSPIPWLFNIVVLVVSVLSDATRGMSSYVWPSTFCFQNEDISAYGKQCHNTF